MWDINAVVEKIRTALKERGLDPSAVNLQCIYHKSVLQELAKLYQEKHEIIDLLGMGGSGVVIKLFNLHQNNFTYDKCIKYPHSLAGTSNLFSLANVLNNESTMLKLLHHQNILPIEDIGKFDLTSYQDIDARDKITPYYLMPYVESIDLDKYAESPYAKNELLVNLLLQVATALGYLHENKYVHLDVKPGNIFIENYKGNNPRALLADFGFCKQMNILSDKSTLVMGTEPYMHPDLLDLMKNRTKTNPLRVRDRIKRSAIEHRFDRYSFGLTIVNTFISFLNCKDENDNPNTMDSGIYRGLMFIAMRCSDGKTQAFLSDSNQQKMLSASLFNPDIAAFFKYNETIELVSNLKMLSDRFRGIHFIQEIDDSSKSNLCLPPRNLAPLSYRIRRTIDSMPVRRLSSVAQLAFCYHIYPGASHNRKEHVIGVYQTVSRLLRYLLLDFKNPICALLLSERHQRIALLASLFHDIAHVPLMHEFEDSIPELKQELYLAEIFERKWGSDNFQKEIDDILSLWDLNRIDMLLVLSNKKYCTKPENISPDEWDILWLRPDYELLRSLFDGAIDADKIDYLQRDALHAGVQFGHAVDWERLTRKLTAALFLGTSDSKKMQIPVCRLASWGKTQTAAESIISVRHGMHSTVYAHKTVRASRAMLNYIVWKWLTSQGMEDKIQSPSDLVFMSGAQLSCNKSESLFELKQDYEISENYFLSDNLPYHEARLIRWIAHRSNSREAREMSEALITRNLYREVSCLGENEVLKFLSDSYPKEKNKYRNKTVYDANDWLKLIDYLGTQLQKYTGSFKSITKIIVKSHAEYELPLLLVDVSIPKTMRSQKELMIMHDSIGDNLSWKRIEGIRDMSPLVLGLDVKPSPVYESFSASDITPVIVRVFCRYDLSDAIRANVESSKYADWLNIYRR